MDESGSEKKSSDEISRSRLRESLSSKVESMRAFCEEVVENKKEHRVQFLRSNASNPPKNTVEAMAKGFEAGTVVLNSDMVIATYSAGEIMARFLRDRLQPKTPQAPNQPK